MKRCLLLGFAITIPLIAGADQACVWMNAATAAGILDGAVEMTIAYPMTCEFARQKSPEYSLNIEVGTRISLRDKCISNPKLLKGIGNEATECAQEGRDGQRIERLAGRVRDQHFVIRVSTHDPSATQASLLEKARRAAEQVAGNLF